MGEEPTPFINFLQHVSMSADEAVAICWLVVIFFHLICFQFVVPPFFLSGPKACSVACSGCWGRVEEDAAELRINYVKHKVKQKDQDPELDHAAWEQVPHAASKEMRVSKRRNKGWR